MERNWPYPNSASGISEHLTVHPHCMLTGFEPGGGPGRPGGRSTVSTVGCGDNGNLELLEVCDGNGKPVLLDVCGENGVLWSLAGRGENGVDLAQSGTGAGPLVKRPNMSPNQSMIGLRNRDPV